MDTERDYFIRTILPLKNRMFRKALYMTDSVEDAEDVVQDVMLQLWDKRKGWQMIDNMEVYAMVLIKNRAIDRKRQTGFYHESLDEIPDAEGIAGTLPPLDELVRQNEKALVMTIIRSLPEKQRKMVILREIEELSYREIADDLNVTEADVKVNIFRARKQIKELYIKISQYGLE
ncbi:MAG: RNA polymerase sigma factor [Tannerella sp.]|jgi:RNA polymerase sigma-70 factor (ECF subfamily)|nr:RNA polymerase sigma factor [Tannerella sp.]